MGNLENRKSNLTESKVSPPAKGPKALSNKPSGLIRQSMADLRAAELSEDHAVNMNVWHDRGTGPGGDTCFVCQAGSVMAGTLEITPDRRLSIGGFPIGVMRKLSALDSFRSGNIAGGVYSMCPSLNMAPSALSAVMRRVTDGKGWTSYPSIPKTYNKAQQASRMESKDWQEKRKRYEAQMQKLADELEKIGL